MILRALCTLAAVIDGLFARRTLRMGWLVADDTTGDLSTLDRLDGLR